MSSQVRDRSLRLDLLARTPSIPRVRLNAWEIAGLLLAAAAISVVIYFYFSRMSPALNAQASARTRYEEQQQIFVGSAAGGSGGVSKAEMIKQAKESLEIFRSERLRPLDPGRAELFKEINALVKQNNAALDSGIEMQNIEGKKQAKTAKKKTAEELLNAFTRRKVAFKVTGPYGNLRALLRELERSKHFLVIDSVKLATIEQDLNERRSRRASGEAVGLEVELTAYFR